MLQATAKTNETARESPDGERDLAGQESLARIIATSALMHSTHLPAIDRPML